MNRKQHLTLVGVGLLVILGISLMWFFLDRADDAPSQEKPEPMALADNEASSDARPGDRRVPRPDMDEIERLLAGLPKSPLDDYVRPETSRRDRLHILGHLFAEYHATFRRIPAGLQTEVYSVFGGQNTKGIEYVPKGHPALNGRGVAVNPEGHEVIAHVISSRQGIYELRDPGPDGQPYNEDDLVVAFPQQQAFPGEPGELGQATMSR